MNKRILGNKSTRCLWGNIVISIKCYCDCFEITLKIPEHVAKGKHLEEENEKVCVNLVKQVDDEVSITRTISYKKTSDGIINPIKIEIPYSKSTFVKGFLIVSPELYLTLGMRKHAQMAQEMKHDFPIEIHKKNPQSSPSRFVPYVGTRSSHPYRG